MSFEVFQTKIKSLVGKVSGKPINVRFSTDSETGRHVANCSDGTIITGCNESLKLTVRWGSGHVAQATV